MMKEIERVKVINELKKIYRFNAVDDRKESSAEHSWSCLLIADYFMSKMKLEVDRLKVYELIMYHDLVEIETGDVQLNKKTIGINKTELEKKASIKLSKRIPKELSEKYLNLFKEYEEKSSIESRFVKAIDAFDAVIHQLDNKPWEGWTKKFLIESKKKYFEEFQEIDIMFDEIVDYVYENGYLDDSI